MLTLVLPSDIQAKLVAALKIAGKREVGGVLMAAHVGLNRFEVMDITMHKRHAVTLLSAGGGIVEVSRRSRI